MNESVPTSKWRSDRIRTCLWCCPECINVPGHGVVMAVGSAKWEAEADPLCLPADTATQEGAHQSPPWNPISSNPQILFQFMGNLEERVRLNQWNATRKIPHMETHYINDCFLQHRNYKKKGKKEEIAVRSMDWKGSQNISTSHHCRTFIFILAQTNWKANKIHLCMTQIYDIKWDSWEI